LKKLLLKQTKKTQPSKETAKEEVKPNPKKIHNLQSTSDALSSILNGPKSNGKAKGGEGNDNIAGDKGSLNGDPMPTVIMDPEWDRNGSGWAKWTQH
jgi:hypothetical protein